MRFVDKFLARLPDAKGAVVVLSGGLDSTTSLRLAIERYGADNVAAISFNYGQRQWVELNLAAQSCERLGVKHQIFQLDFLNTINKGFSANVDRDIPMPTIQDVLGDPAPVTYVANRNMIMMSIAAAVAEVNGFEIIICGFQSNDTYGYHDTTPTFVRKLNDVLAENRKIQIQIIAPFVDLNKKEEIQAVLELDGNLDLFKTTLTCYNPIVELNRVLSCGKCPSCSERMAAFKKLGVADPIDYKG